MPKVLYVATVVKTHIMEFHIPYLKMLKEMGWNTAVAAANDYEDPTDCVIPYCDKYYNIHFERNPIKPGNIVAFKELKKVINEGGYDIIHCHTPVGAMITRIAAQSARQKGCRVFYTAHGFHFYSGAPLFNWLVYYPVERWLARRTDVLITINKEDYNRARNFKAKKVVYVPGVGIDFNRFSQRVGDRNEKRKELGLKKTDFVLLSVGELTFRKNHSLVLDALGELKCCNHLDNVQYLICGCGPLDKELKEKATSLGIAEHVHFLGQRKDVSEVYNVADLFLFMSRMEKQPIALMEAMASRLPVICSDVSGNIDLIKNGLNGELVGNNSQDLAVAILKLMSENNLREKYAQFAMTNIKHYDLSTIEPDKHDIYTDGFTSLPWGEAMPKNLIQVIQSQQLKKRLNIPLDATVLLSVGEVNRNKNHGIVIKILPQHENYWYVLCGRGPLVDEYRKLAGHLGVSDRFIMTGYRTDVEDFYSMADIFVFPSFREGLGMALMEAMAANLPCIAARNRGTKDLLINSELLFNANNINELEDKLQKVYSISSIADMNINIKRLEKYYIQNVLKIIKDLYLES